MAKKAATKAITEPYSVGERLYIRTATYHWAGDVTFVGDGELIIEPACWVADSGRLSNAMRGGFEADSRSELEPVPGPVTINRAGIIDAIRYGHDLPTGVK